MPDSNEPAQHVKPFVYESLNSKALHFSISEIQSRMRLEDPHALDLEYTRTMMGFLLFLPEPRSITMLGLGGGSLAKFCYRYLPQAVIQVVEINPHVIALRDEFHVPPDDARFMVLQGDGAKFVRHSTARCDVLMVDGYDSSGLPSALSSQRFYDDCLDLLEPEGIMVANLHQAAPRYKVCVDRIRRSFEEAVFVAEDGEQGNSIVFACKGRRFEKYRPGVVRRPRNLHRTAAEQLLAAFALVSTALKDQRT